MLKKRYLEPFIEKDLEDKMVFVGGPRQVGKTTMAKLVGEESYPVFAYLNWDNRGDKRKILKGEFAADAKLIIFDEIHKYRMWKNYIKGEFDKNKDKFDILVTGSARLDVYKKGGDSLMGRYHYYRLHPFSLAEIIGKNSKKTEVFRELKFNSDSLATAEVFADLFVFGGFPEPFIKKNQATLRRFHNERLDLLVREDIRDVEQVRDLSALQLLVTILPEKVGSLLSLNSLREDLTVAHKTIALWMDILERFYYHFRIYPFAASAIKSLRKEPKMYLWDWSQIENEASKLENIVASHLLKFAHFLCDTDGHKAELFFLRDLDGREVDFLVTVNKKPWLAVEVKTGADRNLTNLKYFQRKLNIPFAYQVVKDADSDFWKDDIRVISVDKFLSGLV
jgi:uncharacterized protein